MKLSISLFLLLTVSGSLSAWAQSVAKVIEYSTVYECKSAHEAVCRNSRVYLIENAHGKDLADFYCRCDPNNSLSSFSMTVMEIGSKSVQKYKRSDLVRSEYSDHLASDDYFYAFSPSTMRYPALVTVEWEEEYSHGMSYYPQFSPMPMYDVPVQKASFTFIAKAENTLRYRMQNCEARVEESVDKSGRKVTRFLLDSLPALHDYSWALPFRDQMPVVYLAPTSYTRSGRTCDMQSWESFGQWTWSLYQGRDLLPDGVKAELHALTDTCATLRQKVEQVRRYMVSRTRYVSIQLGIGGYQPMPAKTVHEKGVGDCKALTNYFCSLLGLLGIEAHPALIGPRPDLLEGMPNFFQFNHVIAQVPLPGDTLWVECTNPLMPATQVYHGHVGHEVLLLSDKGGQVARIPIPADSLSLERGVYTLEMDALGNASLQGEVHYGGHAMQPMIDYSRLTTKDRHTALVNSLNLPKTQIEESSIRTDCDSAFLSFRATCHAYGKVSGSRIFIPVRPAPLARNIATKEPAHEIDFIGDGRLTEEQYEISLPEGYVIESLPQGATLSCPIVDCSITLHPSEDGRRISVSSRYLRHGGLYGKEVWQEWIAFRANLMKASQEKIVLKKQQ